MKTKYIVLLGGTAVLGVGAYLFFSNRKNKLEITTGEGSLNVKASELGNASPKNNMGGRASSTSQTGTGGSATTTPTTVPTKPYTPEEATAKSLLATSIISQYLAKMPKEELTEKNKDFSVLRKNYLTINDLVTYFKEKGAVITSNEFKNIIPTLSRANADTFIKVYPKLYLKRVLKDFPVYFDKHALDYELTPSEAVFVDEIGYDNLEQEQVNNWILKSTPSRIVIKEAFYGRGKNLIDIKGKLEELIRVGTYSYPATNDFAGGDPEKGERKATYVNYTIDGKPYTLTAFSSDTKGFNKSWNGGGVAEKEIAVLIK